MGVCEVGGFPIKSLTISNLVAARRDPEKVRIKKKRVEMKNNTFTSQRRIRLSDTDATGVIYFIAQLRLAQETLEEYLMQNGSSIKEILEERGYLLPIVHAEADYFAPVKAGDQLDIAMSVKKIGTTSFTLTFRFFKGAVQAGSALLTHVVIEKKSGAPISIPHSLFPGLQSLLEPSDAV